MNGLMANNANRNYVKPMLWLIAVMVMVFLGRLATLTRMSFGRRQKAILYRVVYFVSCSIVFWETILTLQTFLASSVPPYGFFPIFCLLIPMATATTYFPSFFSLFVSIIYNVYAHLTRICFSVFTCFSCIKLSEWFNLLAFTTGFCLNCLSHNLISIIKLWLGPIVSTNLQSVRFILTNPFPLSRRNFQWQ